jgi:hypothetical protein
MLGSAALAQDGRVRDDGLQNDIANAVEPNGAELTQSRILWHTPEMRPRSWEEQRVFDRSSQNIWLFPATETGEY